ncbi:MAG: YhfC family intramembrane metalloprotease [Myxococcales bacterium]|nr:YhfC family intramembrane metalloprotease [Myxococcales bacterium]
MNIPLIVTLVLVGLFNLLFPIVAGIIWRKKTDGKWLYFILGYVTFFVFQIMTRVPAVQLASHFLADWIKSSPVIEWSWLVMLCFTAGLFEESGRYLVLRYILKPPHRWHNGVFFGLGHSGMEMLFLGFGSMIGNLYLLFAPVAKLPAAVQEVRAQLEVLPLYMPLVGSVERILATFAHIAFTLLVLRAVRAGRRAVRWWLAAIAAHGLLNLVAVTAMKLANIWVAEGLLVLLTGVAIWWIRHEKLAEPEISSPEPTLIADQPQ